MEDLKSKYESDKKDIQIKETNLELTNTQLIADRRKVYSLILAFTILFTIVIAYLIYNRTRLKQQRQLDAELIKQQDLRGRAVLEAEEKERIRIARDLHDGVGQLLSAARMQVSGLDHLVKDANESNKSSFQNALKLLDDSVKEVRGVSHSMIPNALLRSGLVAAVREFVDRLSNERMKIDLQIVGLQERLEPQMETVLYRVLQEIVSNTVKYSQAQNLSIQLIRHEQEITLMVEDNGKGFNVAEVMNSEKAGIGIKNIISRVNYLNGEVIFDSSPNNGTTITVEIPIG
jgi:signal transduction histidine kinase